MTPREIVLAQVRHRQTEVVPYTLGMEESVAQRVTAYYGSDRWKQKLVPYIVGCGGLSRRKLEQLGDGRERDLFGGIWRTDCRPFHLEVPALPEPTLEGFTFPEPSASTEPDMVENACRRLEELTESFTTIYAGWGLWELSWGLRGFENAMMDCVAEPVFYEQLLDHLTEQYLGQLALCRDIGADAFMFGDDWGDQRGVMMGPERWRRLFKPRYARIFEAAHKQGKIVACHCCGSVVDIMPDLIEIGLDVLESVQPEARGMNPYDLKKQFGKDLAFWGCLGSQSTIPFGSPEQIRDEVDRLRREMSVGGGYILSPAKALQPETPTENAVAVFEAFVDQG